MDVLTLVHGRRSHLDNLILGLARSTVAPARLIVVHMNEAPVSSSSPHFPIVSLVIEGPRYALPLAAARNLAASHVTSEAMIFLDVDCIPSATLIECYRERLCSDQRNGHRKGALYQGLVRYLPAGASASGWSEETLNGLGQIHAAHDARHVGCAMPHHMFWSLNFACRRASYEAIGGFDTHYLGYGGEDTDFAFRARRAGIGIELVGALAFHQYHAVYDPPLNHFSSIVANARRFKRIWGRWPMEGWLAAFAEAGYIGLTQEALTVRRPPTLAEVAACLTP
ncbi:MAG: hypothetical protein JHC61_07985 [Burkholderiaceae bacterium]|nr:hypothetical protein [Burkholderiaceae bacterium]